MIWERSISADKRDLESLGTTTVKASTVLTIGDMRRWVEKEHLTGTDQHIVFAELHEITPALVASLDPELVLSPLLAPTFDCIDVAQALSAAGFGGKYRALSRRIPSPTLVRREIMEFCPGLDFDIIFVDGFETVNSRV